VKLELQPWTLSGKALFSRSYAWYAFSLDSKMIAGVFDTRQCESSKIILSSYARDYWCEKATNPEEKKNVLSSPGIVRFLIWFHIGLLDFCVWKLFFAI